MTDHPTLHPCQTHGLVPHGLRQAPGMYPMRACLPCMARTVSPTALQELRDMTTTPPTDLGGHLVTHAAKRSALEARGLITVEGHRQCFTTEFGRQILAYLDTPAPAAGEQHETLPPGSSGEA